MGERLVIQFSRLIWFGLIWLSYYCLRTLLEIQLSGCRPRRKAQQYVGIASIAFGNFDEGMRPKIGFI
jgi:hypothetical protein